MNVTERQTDHVTEKGVGIGGIACAARVIPRKNRHKSVADTSRLLDYRLPPLSHRTQPNHWTKPSKTVKPVLVNLSKEGYTIIVLQ